MPMQKPHLHYLLFYVTSRCNLRCKHCFYLDELNQHEEMALDEIQTLARNLHPLQFVRITGGEPFLRKDLPEVIEAFYQHAKTRRVGVITNGTRPEWVEERTTAILKHCPDLSLDIGVSLDGPEAIHDEIRGLKGSFHKAKESAQRLIALKKRFPTLSTSLVTTVTAKNEPVLNSFYEEIAAWGVDRLSVNHIRGKVHDEELKEINYQTYLDFAQRCEAYHLNRDASWKASVQRAKNRLTRQAIEEIVDGKPTRIPCLAGSAIGVLYSDGELYLCEMLNSSLAATYTAPEAHARIGNVRDAGGDFYALWHSEAAQRGRDWIRATNCSCSHECFLTASIYFGKRNYPALAKEWLKTLVLKH
ncbi:MAG: radical SAM protein [bacterium]|nr:radical SAM protein [bacterium]